LAPVSGSNYFENAFEVAIPGSISAPALTVRVYHSQPRPRDDSPGTLFVFHHGAGYSGLSFACLAEQIKTRTAGECGCLAYDGRGHGRTKVNSIPQTHHRPEFSLPTLSADLVNLLSTMFPKRSSAPNIILVGHSMGGAVVTDACPRIQADVANVIGLVVLDVVEGSAMEALQGMTTLIHSQPKGFESMERAIEWHLSSKTLNNLVSAKVSVPPRLRPTVAEDGIDLPLIWVMNLSESEPFGSEWFTSLSNKFLLARTAKLLVLAGTDRLDKDLMIGQMQGKYQLIVMKDVGHCLQEDGPDRLAESLIEFWKRNDRTDVLKGLKKVGQV